KIGHRPPPPADVPAHTAGTDRDDAGRDQMGLLGRRSRMVVTVGVMSAVFGLTAEGPAWATSGTVPDRNLPANAAALADVATSIRAEAAYAAGYTGKGVGIALIDTGVVPVQGLTSGN